MGRNPFLLGGTIGLVLMAAIVVVAAKENAADDQFVSYTVDPKKQDFKFYWKDDQQRNFKSIQNLKSWLERNHEKLVFAMNGGMYRHNHTPQGLFIENHTTVSPLDTASGKGNFYVKPNGVFYLTTNQVAVICNTTNIADWGHIKYATQSGPMLVIDRQIHPAFTKGSTNLNIRNGVGLLPDNKILFAMSKKEINFYDFALYFKSLGCKNALYLDGLVSRTYLPQENWTQLDGNFGVIMGVTQPLN